MPSEDLTMTRYARRLTGFKCSVFSSDLPGPFPAVLITVWKCLKIG
jgi:hypothetical protein